MAIHLTGEISFQNLIDEFGVPKPISLSQMYAGGGYVHEANQGVPISGAISLGNFYGDTAAYVVDYNVTADTFNLNSSTILANSGWDGVTPIILTINISADIVLSSNSTSTPALTIQGDLPTDSKIFVNNSGYIIGMGGAGGKYSGGGGRGGVALLATHEVILNNAGTIAGGGGGGGGHSSGGCGGGGGRSGRQNSAISGTDRYNGTVGTFAAAGKGGSVKSTGMTYQAGNGGDWGMSGGAGNKSGGAGGAAIDGNSLINWVSEGTIKGSRLN